VKRNVVITFSFEIVGAAVVYGLIRPKELQNW